jgi:hypothetical protein
MNTENQIETDDDFLTDEERAAQAEFGDDDQGGDDAAGDDEAAAGAGGDGAADDDAGDAGASAAAGRDDGETDEPGAAAEQPALAPKQTAPILVAEPPADAEEKLADIASKKEALLTQFDDGDITAKEYQQQVDALGKQEREIEFAKHEYEMAQKMELQRQKNDWDEQCATFLDGHKEYSDPNRFELLNDTIKAIAAMPRNRDLTGPQILDKAHRMVLADLGETLPAPAQPAGKKAPAAKPNLPPNLAKVPAADTTDTAGNPFAALDRLQATDPEAYEEALFKLPEAERNRYLAQA